jgi:hypothetical protein
LARRGLDALGRREKPSLDDFVEFLQVLCAYKKGTECDARECQQALQALNVVSADFDHDADAHHELPVLTTTRQLLPGCDVYEDDSPHLKGRIEAVGINFIDAQVPWRIRSAASRLADDVEEILDEPPMRSANRELESLCDRFATILHSREFAYGLRRLVAQKHSWRAGDFVSNLDRFNVCAATSISTSLYLKLSEGEPRRIGGGSVLVFVDDENSTIWVATASPRRVAIDLAREIDGLLREFQGVELAALAQLESQLLVRMCQVFMLRVGRG